MEQVPQAMDDWAPTIKKIKVLYIIPGAQPVICGRLIRNMQFLFQEDSLLIHKRVAEEERAKR